MFGCYDSIANVAVHPSIWRMEDGSLEAGSDSRRLVVGGEVRGER